jgi:hypothetical protein
MRRVFDFAWSTNANPNDDQDRSAQDHARAQAGQDGRFPDKGKSR